MAERGRGSRVLGRFRGAVFEVEGLPRGLGTFEPRHAARRLGLAFGAKFRNRERGSVIEVRGADLRVR